MLLATAVGTGLFGLTLPVLPASAAPTSTTIAILNFNDFHGRIDADTTKFATTIEAQRALYGDANTLLLSAGDSIGASLFASATQSDQPTIDVLNALDLRASAVGNHEFDKGFTDLTDRVINGGTNAQWDYLGANVYLKGTATPALPEYSIQTVGGIKVGVVGVVTREAPTLVTPTGVSTLDFGDEISAVNRVASQLKDGSDANGEADVVVAEFHNGANLDTDLAAAKAESADFADIVDNTSTKVDVLFNGHTHMAYAWTDPNHSGRPIVQAGSYGTKLGKVVLDYDLTTRAVTSADASVLDRAASADTSYPRVAAVGAIVTAALAHAADVGNQPIGALTADITTAHSNGAYTDGVWSGTARDDRAKPSTMGTLVADSLLASLSNPDRGGAEIGIVNPGGLRAELKYAKSGVETTDGVISYAEANSVLPFVNNLWTTTLTGAQLKQVLEEQWQPGKSRPYLALGLSKNVSYTFDPAADLNSRITSIWINGTRVKPTDQIRVGAFNFLITGGDNFATMAKGSNAKDSGLVDYEAWIDYLKAHKPVSPNFARASAALSAPTTAKVGESYTLSVSELDLTSLGSPANTSLEARVGDTLVTTVPVSGGAATATFTMPSTGAVTLTALPSQTLVRVPVTTEALATSTTLKLSKNTVSYGTSVVATAKVTGTATGKVRFTVGARSVEAAVVGGAARAKLPADLAVGTHRVVASFVADDVAAASSSAPAKLKVTKATVTVINKVAWVVASAKKPFSFTVSTKPLGTGIWATGTVKVYLHGRVVETATLTSADKGTKRITVDAKYLSRYGKGSSVSIKAELTRSKTTKDAVLKVIRLRLV